MTLEQIIEAVQRGDTDQLETWLHASTQTATDLTRPSWNGQP